MVVEYADGSGGAIYRGGYKDGEDTSHMMFNHYGGDAFFADMYELARRTRSIIFWPDENPIYLYTDPIGAGRAERDGIVEEARSTLVRSGADIIKAIEAS